MRATLIFHLHNLSIYLNLKSFARASIAFDSLQSNIIIFYYNTTMNALKNQFIIYVYTRTKKRRDEIINLIFLFLFFFIFIQRRRRRLRRAMQ